jgi:hypothetical protein
MLNRLPWVIALYFLLLTKPSWPADLPAPQGLAMPFTVGPSQKIYLPFIRLRPNTCEQISNDFRLTIPPSLGNTMEGTRVFSEGKCKGYKYRQMLYMAPAIINSVMSDKFEYYQNTNSGSLSIGGYATLCPKPPPNPNRPCP